MFIRAKTIKGKKYAYLVSNKWTRKGPRQKVSRYLGPVLYFPQVKKLTFDDIAGYDDSAHGIISQRIALELINHGFEYKRGLYVQDDVTVSLVSGIVKKKDHKVVIGMNGDFLCTYTLKRLLKFRSDKDQEGVATDLAKAFVQAGIPVEPDLFIDVFQKIYRPGQSFVSRKKKKLICVSGTPGTGKTTLSKILARKTGFRYVDVNIIIKKSGLSSGYDKKRQCEIIDTERLSKELEKIYKNSRVSMIIDSHMSHFINKDIVDLVIVTRCSLNVLKQRLKKRGYDKNKIKENLEAETFEVCTTDAVEAGHDVVEFWSDTKYTEESMISLLRKILSS